MAKEYAPHIEATIDKCASFLEHLALSPNTKEHLHERDTSVELVTELLHVYLDGLKSHPKWGAELVDVEMLSWELHPDA